MSEVERRVSEFARNYIPVNEEPGAEMVAAKRVWMYDKLGRAYLDTLAGYSALNFGHGNEQIKQAAKDQLDTGLTLGPRYVRTEVGDLFAQELGELTGYEMILPSNGGVESVEAAIKTAHKYGEEVLGVPSKESEIIVMGGNFHGRTTTVISFSDDPTAQKGFGPYTPGFKRVLFNDLSAVENAVNEKTVAVLFEPIQGEAGIIVPDDGYIRGLREVCTRENILMIADEIQSGFGRTGKHFACDHEDVKPDIMIIGKALGGGVIPSSAVLANRNVLEVMEAGVHGSTYGGNPIAAAVGRATIAILKSGKYEDNIRKRGSQLTTGMEEFIGHGVTNVRSKGLWVGVDIDPKYMSGHEIAQRLYTRNVIAKEAHEQTLRLSPAFSIFPEEVQYVNNQIRDILYIAKKGR